MKAAEIERKIFEIVTAFNAGDHLKAMRSCSAALKHAPRHLGLTHLQASIAFAVQDYELALSSAGTFLKEQPDNVKSRLLAGRAARALGRFDTAVEHFRELLPVVPGIGTELARTLDQAGRREDAMKAWRQVWSSDQTSREAAARLGRMLWEDAQFSEARELLERAVAGEAPASAWFDLGLARQDCGDTRGAAEAFGKALSLKPTDAQAAFNLGAALQNLGQIEEAVSSYRRAYEISKSTLGMIAHALSSESTGYMFLDRSQLVRFLDG